MYEKNNNKPHIFPELHKSHKLKKIIYKFGIKCINEQMGEGDQHANSGDTYKSNY